MPKQATHILLGLLVLFFAVSGCTVITSPTPSAGECPTSVTISGAESALVVNQALDLIATTDGGNNLNYSWAWFFAGELIDTKSSARVTPVEPGEFEVSVVLTAPGCNGGVSDSFQVVVAAAKLSEAEEIEPTPMSTPTPTDTPAAPMATITPSDTPEKPTKTPTPTETAVAETFAAGETNTPSSVAAISKPLITHYELLPGNGLTVCWSWTGTLGPDNNFAVRFWRIDDPRPEARHSITWTTDNCHRFAVNNAQFPQGDYYLNVAVMTGPSDGIHREIIASENYEIHVPDISPTLQPPPDED